MASRSRAFDGWARSRAEEWLGRLTRLLLRRTREPAPDGAVLPIKPSGGQAPALLGRQPIR